MKIAGHPIAVCDWSFQGGSVAQTVQQVRALGLEHVHLALSPLVGEDGRPRGEDVAAWKASGLHITAGMISFAGEDYSSIDSIRRTGGLAPDADWGNRRRWIECCLRVAGDLELTMISTHIGFVPAARQDAYRVMVGRVREVAGLFQRHGICLLMETGQEGAGELLRFIEDVACANAGVNFDAANMILYGAGDPWDAVRTLGRYIRHVHIKDAIGSPRPRVEWGREVALGGGQADPVRLAEALRGVGYKDVLAIEREAGGNRMQEVQGAIGRLEAAFGNRGG